MERKSSNFYVPTEPKSSFVIRIRGINDMNPRFKSVAVSLPPSDLQWHLCKVNKASINMLRIVEPYIVWEYPNLKSVNEFIYKHGYGKISKKQFALTDNKLIVRSVANMALSPRRI